MSVEMAMRTMANDLPEFLEWLAKIFRTYPKQRWDLKLNLKLVKVVSERDG